MFRNMLFHLLKSTTKLKDRNILSNVVNITPVTAGLLVTAACKQQTALDSETAENFNADSLEHEFLIKQATTVNVNAATQLLTVTLVAIQDTSERLRDSLSREIFLVKQALEWGEATPPDHWDELVAVRGTLCDLKHNLRMLCSYMDYAEKLATVAAEVSYLSGNTAASDAICERIEQATRSCNSQKQLNHELQQESLEFQQAAIIASPQLQDKLEPKDNKPKHKT